MYRFSSDIFFPPFLITEGQNKNAAPDIIRGGIHIIYNVFHGSTLVADKSATHCCANGQTRTAISDCQLRSGIVSGREQSLSPTGSSLWFLPDARVFIKAIYKKQYNIKNKVCQSFEAIKFMTADVVRRSRKRMAVCSFSGGKVSDNYLFFSENGVR